MFVGVEKRERDERERECVFLWEWASEIQRERESVYLCVLEGKRQRER